MGAKSMLKALAEIKFLKFILVGIINTLFGYSVFFLLILLKIPYPIAMLIATCVGIIFNFKTIGSLVFANTNYKLLGKFLLVYGLVYITNIAIIKSLLLYISNVYFSGAIAIAITTIFSYFLNKKWVFAGNYHEIN